MNQERPGYPTFSLLCLLGIGLSALSLYLHLKLQYAPGTGKSFCNLSAAFNCDAVNRSPWATIFGIPLATLGLLYHLFLLQLGMLARSEKYDTARLLDVALFLSAGGVLFSLYLFYVSHYKIGTFCILCLGLYFVILIQFLVLLLLDSPRRPSHRLYGGMRDIVRFPLYLFSLPAGIWNHIAAFVCMSVVFIFVPDPLTAALIKKNPPAVDPYAIWSRGAEDSALSIQTTGPDADYTQGPEQAAVTIVEFADYECPFCREFYFTLKEVLARYPGKIRFVFKDFPLDMACNPLITQPAHEFACAAAEFARCAGEQGKYWETASVLMTLPELDAEKPGPEVLQAMERGGKKLLLDEAALQECLGSDRQLSAIKKNAMLGEALRLEGTPSVWINRRPVPPDFFEAGALIRIIDGVLAADKE